MTAFSIAAEIGLHLPLPEEAAVVHSPSRARAIGRHRAWWRASSRGRIAPRRQHPMLSDPPRGGGMASTHGALRPTSATAMDDLGVACLQIRRGCPTRANSPGFIRRVLPHLRGQRQACQRRERRHRARARRRCVRTGRSPGWPDDAAAALGQQMGPSRKPAPGSMARGAIRERTMRQPSGHARFGTRGTRPAGSIGMRYPTRGYRLAVVRRTERHEDAGLPEDDIENGPIARSGSGMGQSCLSQKDRTYQCGRGRVSKNALVRRFGQIVR